MEEPVHCYQMKAEKVGFSCMIVDSKNLVICTAEATTRGDLAYISRRITAALNYCKGTSTGTLEEEALNHSG